MASTPAFDPYHRWLGIAPKDQPPHHYRLLGVDLFESDGDVLDMAADQRMSHLRTFQNGPTSALSQKLLNEVSAARVCLLNREKKAAYDVQLRAKLEPPPRATAVPSVSVEPVKPVTASAVPRVVPLASAVPRPVPTPLDKLSSKVGSPLASNDSRGDRTSSGRKLVGQGKASLLKTPAALALVVLVLGLVALAGVFWGRSNPPQQEFAKAVTAGQNSDDNGSKMESVPRTESSRKLESKTGTTPGAAGSKKDSQDRVALLPEPSQPVGTGQEMRSPPATTRSEQPQTVPGSVNRFDFGGHRIEFLGELIGHSDPINCVALSRDGQWALSGGQEKSVRLWDVSKLQPIRDFASHTQEVDCVAISPDGKLGLSGGGHGRAGDCALRVWDLTSGAEKRRLAGHSHKVRGVVLLPNGTEAISVSYDSTIRLWNLLDGTDVKHFEGPPAARPVEAQVWSLAISHGSRTILAGLRNNSAHLYEIDSGQEKLTFHGEGRSCFGAVAFAPDDRYALTASNGFSGMESALYYWDLASGSRLRHTPWTRGQITSVVFLPDSKYALITCHVNEILVWDAENGVQVQQITGHTGPVTSLAISADGRTLISGSADRKIRVWSLK